FAFRHGARVCSVIPCRATNGFMEQLQKRGEFHPPCISSLYNVLRESLSWNRGRVFADLWDIDDSGHPEAHSLLAGLRQMNRTQKPC
ncbi:MAG: radical SAM protein, partial [Planctomycetaceae bacterium]